MNPLSTHIRLQRIYVYPNNQLRTVHGSAEQPLLLRATLFLRQEKVGRGGSGGGRSRTAHIYIYVKNNEVNTDGVDCATTSFVRVAT